MTSFANLPLDLQRLIITKYLSTVDAVIFRGVSTRFRQLVPRSHLVRVRRHIYEHAAARGYLSILKWLCDSQRIPIPFRVIEIPLGQVAALNGHQKVLEWLIERGAASISPKLIYAALSGGHQSLYQWLKSKYQAFQINDSAYCAAAESGLKSIFEEEPPTKPLLVSCRFCDSAAENFNFEMMFWLWEKGFSQPSSSAISPAIRSGRYDLMWKLLADDNSRMNIVLYRELAKKGRVDLMLELREKFGRDFVSDSWVVAVCAMSGQLDTLKILRADCIGPTEEHRSAIDRYATYLAAGKGQLECLRYIWASCSDESERRELVDTPALANGARHGQMDVVKFFIEEAKVPCTAYVMEAAASQGHLSVMSYLLEQKCPINDVAAEAAAGGGYIEILQWLRDKGLVQSFTPDAACRAVLGGRFATLRYLHRNGCPMHHSLLQIAQDTHDVEIQDWLKRVDLLPDE